jgi:prepilin-type N-terminal cleavage/methylation domain-containing protein
MKRKGFTLIELLVVIAIIGLLSTLAVVSLNGARSKARDAKRLSDVKAISTAIELSLVSRDLSGYDKVLLGCDTAGHLTTACTALAEPVFNFSAVSDPSGSIDPCERATAAGADCAYALGVDPTSDDYEICFSLENNTGNLLEGVNKISVGGTLTRGCTN